MEAIAIDLQFMFDDAWKEAVRDAARLARDSNSVNMAELERQCGWNHPQLSNFIRLGTGKTPNIIRLEAELRVLGFYEDPFLSLAKHCYAIGDMFASRRFSDSEKGAQLQIFINSLSAANRVANRLKRKSRRND